MSRGATYIGAPCKHCESAVKYVSSQGCRDCSIKRNSFKLNDAGLMEPYRRYSSVKRRRALLKQFYNLTPEQYESLLIKQKHRCAICRTASCPTGRNFAVDHEHGTKVVRGLLCCRCNQGLGNFQDQIDNLEAAIRYLRGLANV